MTKSYGEILRGAEAPKINFLDAIKYAWLLPQILQVVAGVQALYGAGNGPAKKEAAMKIVIAALAIAEGVAEKDLVNNEAALEVASGFIELAVQMMQLYPQWEDIVNDIRGLKPVPEVK